MRDDIHHHPRDPRYLDLAAALVLLAVVTAALVLTSHAFMTVSVQPVGVGLFMR